jgi:CheY-like chemotaxis protein
VGASILLIEDNRDNLELINFLLSALGHTPRLAVSGPRGIEAAKRELPDLILLDIQMPEMDGFEVLRIIRTDPALSSTPVVALTAVAMVGDRETGLRAGFDGYITKPITPEAFADELDAYLAPELRSRRPWLPVEAPAVGERAREVAKA